MATPIASNFTRLTPPILKFKALSYRKCWPFHGRRRDCNLATALSSLNSACRSYIQTKVSLPEDIRKQIFDNILDEFTGFGPIQPLLDDPDISEVMVNGRRKSTLKRSGKLTKSPITFDDDDHVLRIIDRIILPLGRRVEQIVPPSMRACRWFTRQCGDPTCIH